MNSPAWLLVILWLVWDTFRQSLASRIFWLMLAVSGVCIVFCLSTSVEGLPHKPVGEVPERIPKEEAKRHGPAEIAKSGVDVPDGEVSFLFGAVRVPWVKYHEDAVRWLQLVLAGFIADTLGLLLALIWTAAFLPTFLEPSSISVLLAKPVPRWSLLAGKYVGVLAFVTFQALVFVLGTWLALGVRTGTWAPHYLWCVPVLVIHFAVFFSFSCMLAVWTRSTVVCILGSLLFWFVCWGVNYGRHHALAETQAPRAEVMRANQAAAALGASTPTGSLGDAGRVAAGLGVAKMQEPPAPAPVTRRVSTALELGYWVLPKPVDVGILLGELLGAEDHVTPVPEYRAVKERGSLHLDWSVLASCLFALVMLGVAGYEFVKADY
jgi:ABC-2 family transporter protein